MDKYGLVRSSLISQKIVTPEELIPATPLSLETIALAHDESYIQALINQTLPEARRREIGFPLSERLVLRSRSSAGGFLEACQTALQLGLAGNLSGGTHHAHRDRGEGFCVFNDFAIASFWLMKYRALKKILILDLDVHQGNGNSSIMGQTPGIDIISFHGKNNYPYRKVASSLDVEFNDFTEDSEYLHRLTNVISGLATDYQIILYQAGVDALKEDTLGKLSLSMEGLRKRDELVFGFAKSHHIPVAVALGGGYSKPIDLTVRAHVQTFMVASDLFYKKPPS